MLGKIYNTYDAVPGGLIHSLYGKRPVVNSYHHQAIKDLGQGLRIDATAGPVVEAVVHEHLPIFAVQWHPEKLSFACRRDDADDGVPVLKHFVDLCRGK